MMIIPKYKLYFSYKQKHISFQMTKAGRYGLEREDFDYSPATIRKSVERSLSRLHTSYLDVVYLHDVEFVADEVMPRREGDHRPALDTEAALYGLAPGQEAKVWGEGDQRVLNAYAELQKLQSEGVIKHIGITGNTNFSFFVPFVTLFPSFPSPASPSSPTSNFELRFLTNAHFINNYCAKILNTLS